MPETIESTGVELVESPAASRALFAGNDPDEIVAAVQRVATALKSVIAAKDMVMRIGGREYVRAEALQALATITDLTTEIEWTRPLPDDSGWEARAIARTADGRTAGSAEAMCTREETHWANRPPYALRAMAQTRAVSRALRAPLGFVMVAAGASATAAEEMDVTTADDPPALPVWARAADVPATAEALVDVLTAAGVPEPAKHAGAIGQRIFETCGGAVPAVVLTVLRDIKAAVPTNAEADQATA
jgi:hypothetical protein